MIGYTSFGRGGCLFMQKSKKWQKRLVLIALAGTIGMTFSGCKNKDRIAVVQKTETTDKTRNFYKVSDLVLIEFNTMYKKCVKVMQLESMENNNAYFKSITDEEIGAVILNFDSEEEKCIVTGRDVNGDFIYDENFRIGTIDHFPVYQFEQFEEMNEENKVSYALIEKVEEELEKNQEEDIVKQENQYAEDLLKYILVIDANKEMILTPTVREISYVLQEKNYELLVYLEKETAEEQVYRSITNPKNSISIKLNEEGKPTKYILQTNETTKEEIELENILGDYKAIVGRFITFEKTLDFETSSFISYNYQKFNKTKDEVTALVCKVEDNYHLRIMEYVGELDNQVLYQAKVFNNAAVWVLGTRDETQETIEYQIVGPMEWKNKEFISMDSFPKSIELSDEEVLKIEADYESKKDINDNFNLIENSNEEWKTYKSLAKINYSVQGTDESFVLMAGLEKVEENRNLYRCITIPEIYLEETFEPDNYMTTYRLIPVEGIQEDFTKTTEVTNVTFKLVGKSIYTLDEILLMEEEAQKELNEELNSGLGR